MTCTPGLDLVQPYIRRGSYSYQGILNVFWFCFVIVLFFRKQYFKTYKLTLAHFIFILLNILFSTLHTFPINKAGWLMSRIYLLQIIVASVCAPRTLCLSMFICLYPSLLICLNAILNCSCLPEISMSQHFKIYFLPSSWFFDYLKILNNKSQHTVLQTQVPTKIWICSIEPQNKAVLFVTYLGPRQENTARTWVRVRVR